MRSTVVFIESIGLFLKENTATNHTLLPPDAQRALVLLRTYRGIHL